jgi:FKBP-type peptidyl-prolyl cis-trans isomerase
MTTIWDHHLAGSEWGVEKIWGAVNYRDFLEASACATAGPPGVDPHTPQKENVMKQVTLSLLLVGLLAVPAAAQPAAKVPAGEPAPKTVKDQASYSIGYDIGRSFKDRELDLELAMIVRGMKDALAGTDPALTEEQMVQAMEEFQKAFQQQMAQRAKKAAEEGVAFLAANGKKEGVVTTASGLQYKVLKQGTGPSPKATDVVRTHYEGTFINGKVFDSSIKRNEPATFGVNQVIPGWTEALQLMKVGDKWQLFVPSKLAYGPEGSQGAIPPDSTLIFEVELLEIVDPAAAPKAPR